MLISSAACISSSEGWREVAPESSLQAQGRTGRPPNVHLQSGVVERTEESEAENVVHVDVGQQHVDPGESLRQLPRERPNAGPRVEHDDASVRPGQAHARRVTAGILTRKPAQLNSPRTYSWVYCSFGSSKIACVGPDSTRYPVRPPFEVST